MHRRTAPTGKPAQDERWLENLAAENVHARFDASLAETLRVVAGMRQDAVCLCSGPGALPYVGWLRDGLRMSSRLIIHLDPSLDRLEKLIRHQQDDDIRVAGHFQDLQSFGRDIARHRIDLLVADFDGDNRHAMGSLMSLLTDEALMVILADEDLQCDLRSDYATEYFVADAGSSAALLLSRKGRQHRLARRGSRRRELRRRL